MAKFEMGAIVNDISGTIDGTTYSKNKYSNYMKGHRSPTNKQTNTQLQVRADLTNISKLWQTLTDAERKAWDNFALANEKTSIFGKMVSITGFNAFVKLNMNLAAVGVAYISNPPLNTDVVGLSNLVSLTATASTQVISLVFTATPTDVTTSLLIKASNPLSAGKAGAGMGLRVIKFTAGAATSPISLGTVYTSVIGSFQVGQKIFIEVTPINNVTGVKGGIMKISTIAV